MVFENEIIPVHQGIFLGILISKMGVKMNLRVITKNHAGYSKVHQSHPTALELTACFQQSLGSLGHQVVNFDIFHLIFDVF